MALDKYFTILKLKDENFYFCYFDTTLLEFKIYDSDSCYNEGPFFEYFTYKDNLYLLTVIRDNSKQFYSYIFKIDKDNINFCKKYKLQQQDITYILDYKWKSLIKIKNGLLKVYIESYSLEFNWTWLFFWWAPRGAPDKWGIDYNSRKDYCYTLDEDLNVISIEEIPIDKKDK